MTTPPHSATPTYTPKQLAVLAAMAGLAGDGTPVPLPQAFGMIVLAGKEIVALLETKGDIGKPEAEAAERFTEAILHLAAAVAASELETQPQQPPTDWYPLPDGWRDTPVTETGDLALFLGGSHDSFTGLLLLLFVKADPGNYRRLAKAFPWHARALETWQEMDPAPTMGQLAGKLNTRPAGG